MSKGEVKSLNDLAMAHGGHLTINPHTGLPEAGFLSSILPMIAGVGLTAISGGAINPMTAGLLVGGLTGVSSGSLSKGLMAGLGAYGGAGLGEALASSGMQAAAAPEMTAAQSKLSSLTPAQISEFQAASEPVTSGPVFEAQQAAQQAAQKMAAQQAGYGAGGYGSDAVMGRLSTMGEGIKSLGQPGGFSNLAANAGGNMGLAKYGMAAAAPLLSESPTVPKPAEDKDLGQRYEYSPGVVMPTPRADPYGREQRYFSPSYTPISSDRAKGIYGFAGGGPIEAMSNANAIGANTGYPMADISKGAYATPYQTPISRNVIADTSDTGVSPITGEMTNFADGGVATATPMPGEKPSYEYDPMKQLFSKIESMPSDDQTRQMTEKRPMQGGIPAHSGYEAPSTQGLSEGIASGLVGYGSMGFMPGGFIAKMLGQSMINSALANAALNGGYTGTFTGPAAFSGGVGNITTEGSSGPISGEAFSNSGGGGGEGGGGGRGGAGNVGTGNGSTASGVGTGIGSLGGMGGGLAAGGLSHLGDYSDGGRLLRGPGDGVSDSIPAVIGKKQPARLADGEFVVPARIVSELGNGSTEAGARKLYAMMDRIQSARSKTVGKGKIAKNSRAEKYLPA
jgi:hypothetical protein